ncbi:Hypothetical protein SMAX5B_021241 [Scophthalmus maximus]|uniref:C-type lectin domain-containing protein n=1 Tax=Scophthalmus maximus TaxID=52904 RepID=A0A2U9BSU9_SCOMX|nr:Hypothetical protein SMAX5B_021241 [Scophthalmus maximus]
MSRLVKEFVEEQPVGTLKAAWIGLTDKKDEKNFVWVNGPRHYICEKKVPRDGI